MPTMMRTSLAVYISLVGSLVTPVRGELLNYPSNTVAVAGSRAMLQCTSTKGCASVQWSRKVPGKRSPQPIYKDSVILADVRHSINSSSTSNQCDLVINPVKAEDAGLYMCDDNRNWLVESPRAAFLVILLSDPVCDTSGASTTTESNLSAHCTVKFVQGNDVNAYPVFDWMSKSGSIASTESKIDGGMISRAIVGETNPRIDPISCSIHFRNFSSSFKMRDQSDPPYRFNWTSVVFPAKDGIQLKIISLRNESFGGSLPQSTNAYEDLSMSAYLGQFQYQIIIVVSAVGAVLITILVFVIYCSCIKKESSPRKIKSSSLYEFLTSRNETSNIREIPVQVPQYPRESYTDIDLSTLPRPQEVDYLDRSAVFRPDDDDVNAYSVVRLEEAEYLQMTDDEIPPYNANYLDMIL